MPGHSKAQSETFRLANPQYWFNAFLFYILQPLRTIHSLFEPVTPFTQEKTHKSRSRGSPILCLWWFTQSEASPHYRQTAVNSHRKPALQLLKRCDVTSHGDDVQGVFPCPSVNLTPSPTGRRLFDGGEVHWSLGLECWPWFIFITNTELKFFVSDRRCFSGRNVMKSQ